MQFIRHDKLAGLHATFSPSQSSWLRYDDDKAIEVYENKQLAKRGTILHAWAKDTIDLGIKQPKTKKTLYAYVNDAIGFNMDTEVILYYSDRFFGTADAISFRKERGSDKKGVLRIHDLKTGKEPARMEQLKIYAALFCLEYKYKPDEIDIELRIYQNNEILYHLPEPDEIFQIMDTIVRIDSLLNKIEYEEV